MTATAAVALAVPAATAAKPAASVTAASCTYGKIGGHTKCLRRGEYCARRYERQYEHSGFTCSKRDRRGDWHLE